jgi:hypothetical protein
LLRGSTPLGGIFCLQQKIEQLSIWTVEQVKMRNCRLLLDFSTVQNEVSKCLLCLKISKSAIGW